MTVENRVVKIDNDSLRRIEGSFNRVALAIQELNQTIKEATVSDIKYTFVNLPALTGDGLNLPKESDGSP